MVQAGLNSNRLAHARRLYALQQHQLINKKKYATFTRNKRIFFPWSKKLVLKRK